MKLLSYGLDPRMEPRLAFLLRDQAVDVMRASLWMKKDRGAQDFLNLASSMKLALESWDRSLSLLTNLHSAFNSLDFEKLSVHDRTLSLPISDIVMFAPVPDPPSLRYFNAFNEERPLEFTFGNTQTLLGHNTPLNHSGLKPQGEIAAIIATNGERGQTELAGYCVANNWCEAQSSAHDGLSKGKATSLGPWLVTADELESHKLGGGYNLDMQIRVNGLMVGEGHFKQMATQFSKMIETASPTRVQAGDIFCSGSPLDLNPPLKSGDQVEVEIQALGVLSTVLG